MQEAAPLLMAFDFARFFVEALGWSRPTSTRAVSMQVGSASYRRTMIAHLGGVTVFEISASDDSIPTPRARQQIAEEIGRYHHENLLIFVDGRRERSLWYRGRRAGPKHFPAGFVFVRGQDTQPFLDRLRAAAMDPPHDEEEPPTVVEVSRWLDASVENVWLFQARPEYYDVTGPLQQGISEDAWTVTRYRNEMRVGDLVVIWASGKRGGVVALARLTSTPYERDWLPTTEELEATPYMKAAWWVKIRYTHRMSVPLGPAMLKAHPVLRDLPNFKFSQASNYRILPEHWAALKSLLDEQGERLIAVPDKPPTDLPDEQDQGENQKPLAETSLAPSRRGTRVSQPQLDLYGTTDDPSHKRKAMPDRLQHNLAELDRIHGDLLDLGTELLSGLSLKESALFKQRIAFISDYQQRLDQLGSAIEGLRGLVQDAAVPAPKVTAAQPPSPPTGRAPAARETGDIRTVTLNDDFTKTSPLSMVIDGVTYTDLGDWTNVYRTILSMLAARDPDHCRRLPDMPPFPRSLRFCTDPTVLRRPVQVIDGVYTESNLSANDVRNRIKILMDEFALDPKQVSVDVRPTSTRRAGQK